MEQRDERNGVNQNPAGSSRPRFEVVEHTADWAVRVTGRDFADLLRNAAEAMNGLLVGEDDGPGRNVEIVLDLTAFDRESMLVEWLGELAYWAETDGLVFPEIHFAHVSPESVKATVRGGRISQLQKHIKAVTYHNLEVEDTPTGLEATVVFDV